MKTKKEIFTHIARPKLEKVYLSKVDDIELTDMDYEDSFSYSMKDNIVKVVFNRKCEFEPKDNMDIEVSYRVLLKLDKEIEVNDEDILNTINSDIEYISSDAMARISTMISEISAEVFDGPLVTPPVFKGLE